MLGFLLFKYYPTWRKPSFIIIAVLGAINCYRFNDLYDYLGVLFLFILFKEGLLKVLITPPLLYLGAISYPLYLCHQTNGYVLISYLKQYNINSYVSILIAVAVSLLLSVLVHELIERRLNKLFYRFANTVQEKLLGLLPGK